MNRYLPVASPRAQTLGWDVCRYSSTASQPCPSVLIPALSGCIIAVVGPLPAATSTSEASKSTVSPVPRSFAVTAFPAPPPFLTSTTVWFATIVILFPNSRFASSETSGSSPGRNRGFRPTTVTLDPIDAKKWPYSAAM